MDKCQEIKDDSLLSNLSNLSYQAKPQPYNGSDFFKASQTFNHNNKSQDDEKLVKVEEVDPNNLNAQLPGTSLNFPLFCCENWILGVGYPDGNSGQLQSENIQPHHQEIKEEIKQQHQEEEKDEEPIGTITKNQTKNIPKNYGKAIIAYIQKYQKKFQPILDRCGVNYNQLLTELSKKKKTINTIANLREMWVDYKYERCMRILSNHFLKRHALHYIFNSRICNYTSHVKYRKRLEQAIETPSSFCHIKQY